MLPANATVRITEMCWALCADGRIGAAGGLMDADFIHDDRRRGLTNCIVGRDETLENNRVLTQMGFRPDFDVLQVQDDEVALVRVVFRNRTGDEIAALQVLGTDVNGLRTYCVSFDEDDLDGAHREFELRSRKSV